MDHPNPYQNPLFNHAPPRDDKGYQIAEEPGGSTPAVADPTADYYDGTTYGISPGIKGLQHDQYPLGPLESAGFDAAPAHVAYPNPPPGDGYTSPPLVGTHSAWQPTGAQPTWTGGNWGGYPLSAGLGDGVVYDYEVDSSQSGAGDMAASLPYGAAIASGTSSTVWAATSPTGTEPPLVSAAHSQSTGSTGPSSDKGKRKRGRPRLYDDDGTPRVRAKPGRPPIYTIEPESAVSFSPESLRRSPSLTSPPPLVTSASSASGSGAGSSSGSGSGWSDSKSGSSRAVSFAPTALSEDQEEGDKELAMRSSAVRARNKAAAARYRAKTQNAIATMEAEEREVRLRRDALLATAGRLRDEVFKLKNEVLLHADCGCPLISGYLSEAAQRAYACLGEGQSAWIGQVSAEGQVTRVIHAEECPQNLQEGWDAMGYLGVMPEAVASGYSGDLSGGTEAAYAKGGNEGG